MIEQPLSAPDVEFVTTLHGDEPVSFVLLMQPRGDQDRLLRAIDDVALGELGEAVREAEEPEGEVDGTPAARALDHSLRALRAAGSEATGRLVEDEPLDALTALVAETGADEVIVLTEPHYVEEFFHRDWATRARHKVGVPVLRLYSHAPADGADAPTHTSSGSGATAAGAVEDQGTATDPAPRAD
ncbi:MULTISPECIES: indole-3-glycerol-phosphate synthase [unclassified Streptomyces]|uniref:indole-3-glycerol-phosphate synthase n=1 Tax=unclassified Streptomyces TaxID=2593676 RepID=UPI0003749E26|nr:indole-3-glycerol-phosphate synthase [Streptomyces sp. LaPpAH-202]MYW60340.1 indole-3-glycerol phosphate synthase [Streptomyces sp. SID8370]MYW88910.1 indole-3-glycerol phosphate synthase [Streptomyces sp. SID8371]